MKTYAAILAGGVGKRFGRDLPKQYIEISGEPIIVRTLRRVLTVKMFDVVIIAVHCDWIRYCKDIIKSNGIEDTRIRIVQGGEERIDTIECIVKEIMRIGNVSEQDVVVVCDAVRPFINQEMLEMSIGASRQYGACVCGVPVVDTMLYVENEQIVDVPMRMRLYHGQAPDSCRVNLLVKALTELSAEERSGITGTAQILVSRNISVHVIPGHPDNIKITKPEDLRLAERIINEVNRR